MNDSTSESPSMCKLRDKQKNIAPCIWFNHTAQRNAEAETAIKARGGTNISPMVTLQLSAPKCFFKHHLILKFISLEWHVFFFSITPSFVNLLFRVGSDHIDHSERRLEVESKTLLVGYQKKPSGCQITLLKSNIMLTTQKYVVAFQLLTTE